MKSFTFNKNSWHYKIVDSFDPIVTRDGVDLCTYVRTLLLAVICFSIIFSFIGLIVGLGVYAIGNLIGVMFLGYMLEPTTIIVLIGYGVVLAFAGGMYIKHKLEVDNWDKPKKEPGFVRLAYRSWKEKFCARLEFE